MKQDKLLPLRCCPLQIELGLVNNGADAVHVGSYNGETHTANFDMTDVQVKCDLLTLDNSLENEYASHLLSGKHCLSISQLGTILTNRQGMIIILVQISIEHLLDFSRCLSLCIVQMVLGTNKQTIFTILL